MPARPYNPDVPIYTVAPLLRFVWPLMVGILLQWYQPMPLGWLLAASIGLVVVLVIIMWLQKASTIWFGIWFHLVFGLAGCWLVYLQNPANSPHFIKHAYKPGQQYMAVLVEPPLPKAITQKAEAEVWLMAANGDFKRTVGKAFIYLPPSDSLEGGQVSYGQAIVARKPLRPIVNSGNPGAFNFEEYTALHGIYYQVFLKPGEFTVVPGFNGSKFWQHLYGLRAWVLQVLQDYLPNKVSAGVAEALLVGYRADLDKTLVEQYANAGVVHIIAISGMHLGMIYLVLQLLMAPLLRSKAGKWPAIVFILCFLWGFALLTGAAPSITRAAVMFSAITIGKAGERNYNLYNALALAAICLLVSNPFALWNAGFQLSFAAVLSIALFYKPIFRLWRPRHRFGSLLWNLTCVTLAAQICTLPFAIYHFHQFPVWFLVANLIAVPLSTIILYGLLILLACSPFKLLAQWLGSVLSRLIEYLNGFISWVGSQPTAIVDNIYYTIPHTLLLAGTMAAFAWWWLKQKTTGFWLGSLLLLCLVVARWVWLIPRAQQQQMTVYNVPRYGAIDFWQGNHYQFVGDSALAVEGFASNFHLKPGRIMAQAYKPLQTQSISSKNYLITWQGHRIIWLRQPFRYRYSRPVQADVAIIGGQFRGMPNKVLQFVKAPVIVLEASVPAYKMQQWQTAADSLHLRLHSVALQGAFSLNANTK